MNTSIRSSITSMEGSHRRGSLDMVILINSKEENEKHKSGTYMLLSISEEVSLKINKNRVLKEGG